MAKLLIYRASAGSGKTHTLVTHYIKWALRYPYAFKHILAVTFTNRATQEMKQRIIAYLYSLSIGEDTVLLEELRQMGWASSELQERSKEVLSMIVHQYGDFSITTIDSFFYSIIQSFTKELGLRRHFSVEMDQALALQETVEKLTAIQEPLLQQWIVDFSITKLLAGKTWNVENDIQNLGKTLFEESFKLYERELLTDFKQQDAFSHFLAEIKKYLTSFEQKMQKIGRTALTVLEEEGLTPGDFAYGSKGVIGYFLKIASKKDFEPSKRAIIGSDSLKSWRSKSKQETNKEETIIRVVVTTLHPLLMEAIALYKQERLRYRTAVVVANFTYAFGVVGALLMGLEQYRSRHNVLFISDISALLYRIIEDNETSFLYERIGTQFNHFLIDEFQDLSLFQWTNIKPLLRNSLAQGYTNLLVGDVKQSIYRWRGSSWKILNHQVEQEFKESNRRALTTNRRSQELIVLFNNNFFSIASNLLVGYLKSALDALEAALISTNQPTFVASLWHELAQIKWAYGDVSQQVIAGVPGSSAGYIEFLFIRSDQIDKEEKAVSWKACAQEEIIMLVAQLQQEGVQAKDIALLVRNNSEAGLVTSLFSSKLNENCSTYPYVVRSDHSRSLWSHMAIKVLIYTLYYLENESNEINKVAWVQAYCSCMEQSSIIWHNYVLEGAGVMTADLESLFPKSFWIQKDFLKSLSIYACVELLIQIFFEKKINYSSIISFFQSIILDFSSKETGSIKAFLIWWEKRGKDIKLPVSNNENTVQVMTIHQAKGLEFKVVIMPFCSWSLDHTAQNGPMLWSSSCQQNPFNRFSVLPLNYGGHLKETYYATDYYLEHMQIHLDNLNLLYVAFTRAKERLYVMAPLPEKVESMDTTADLMYQSFVTQKEIHVDGRSIKPRLAADVKETPIGTKYCFR